VIFLTCVSERLASFVCDLDYCALPNEISQHLKMVLLDAFGVILAGSSAVGIGPLVELIREWGGKPESTVMVFGDLVPAPWAALVNGAMLHARELDDTHEEASVHAMSAVLPAALAAAEKAGADGREFFCSLVAGAEIGCRLGLSVRILRGWHFSAVCGVFGAAAAAGRLLGLDRGKMVDALGLAFTRAAGNLQPGREGAMAKRLQPAFAAHSGLICAELAKKGITGPKQVFEGQYSFFRLYDSDYYPEYELRRHSDGSEYERDAITKGLGEIFEVGKLSLKPYGSCRFTHGPLEAALNLVEKYGLQPEKVQSIQVLACPRAVRDYGKPFDPEASRTPEVAAQFSIPYVVAAAFVRRSGYIDSFTREAVLDPRVKDLVPKVRVAVHPEAKLKVPVEVRVVTVDGAQYVERIDALKGSPERSMSREEVLEKFRRNVGYAARKLVPEKLSKLVQAVQTIETLATVRELTTLCT
jgi:2-methylcitrate dehydratase PrpD